MTHNNKPNKGYPTNLGLFCHKLYGKKVEILHCLVISSIGNDMFCQIFLKKNPQKQQKWAMFKSFLGNMAKCP